MQPWHIRVRWNVRIGMPPINQDNNDTAKEFHAKHRKEREHNCNDWPARKQGKVRQDTK